MSHAKYIMVDGPDGAGKGEIIKTIEEFLMYNDFHFISTSEPTKSRMGRFIREKMITGQKMYSAADTARAFAADRRFHVRKIVLPALDKGAIVAQDRGLPSSLAYQTAQAYFENEILTIEEILSLNGNKIAMENAPGLILVPNVPVEKAMQRLNEREKKDNTFFEDYEFQQRVRDFYFSPAFKKIFDKSDILPIDTSKNKTDTRENTLAALEEYFKRKELID